MLGSTAVMGWRGLMETTVVFLEVATGPQVIVGMVVYGGQAKVGAMVK